MTLSGTLVLWDVDHTLMETGGVGREVYASAFQAVTGRRLERMAEVSGRTEPVIFRETLRLHGLDDPGGLFDRFAKEQAHEYAERAGEMRQRGRALPGAAEALRALAARPEVIQSVLTGNTRPSATVKLRAFGLDGYLDLDVGAYGTDDDTRAELVGIARERAARAYGMRFGRQTTILIGDTPNDVAAARQGGARVIAVATGHDSQAALDAAGADVVLPDLAGAPVLIAMISGDDKPS